MKKLLVLLAMLPAVFSPAARTTPSPTPVLSPTPIVLAEGVTLMQGKRLLVTSSSPGLGSQKEAKLWAVKDAAAKASEFIAKQGLGEAKVTRRGIEEALLRETPLLGHQFGDLRIDDLCQERWSNENGVDHYSVHLTLSLRLSQK